MGARYDHRGRGRVAWGYHGPCLWGELNLNFLYWILLVAWTELGERLGCFFVFGYCIGANGLYT